MVVGSSRSTPRPVTSGIPQGSVLGPVLFVIYINDLPLAVKSRLFLFADDAKIYRPIVTTDDRAVLQQDLRSMGGWSLIWLLIYHPEKCKSMTVSNDGGTREEAIYQLGDTVLQQTTSEKDLGVNHRQHSVFRHAHHSSSQQGQSRDGSHQEDVQTP